MLQGNLIEPLYIKIYSYLKEKIEKNILQEGSKLPSENELSRSFKVSRSTIRQALGELEKHRLIYKEKGKGSFVSIRPLNQYLNKFYSFSSELKKSGRIPKYRLLSLKKIYTSKEIKEIMKLEDSLMVYKIEIIRKIENEPILFETTFLPSDRFFNFQRYDLNERALYDIFQEDYNIIFSNAEQSFYPILPNDKIKKLLSLNLSEEVACMKVERISYEGNRIIEYTTAIVKGEKFKYTVNLKI